MAFRGHTWEGGTLCCVSTLSARPDGSCHCGEEEERWKGKGKEGCVSRGLTAPEWPVPRATTSGDHLQLAHPASSILVPFPPAHAHFVAVFFQMGEAEWGRSGREGVIQSWEEEEA
ncbi:hypothetical protein KUCAC02_027447 [Chaenocephalus aceratus]|uniref:Uncharacterized protein n=1 Tax=Chaenocephalus aceratus TaxID=36190 RepID=A0ACB9W413_CHAAC|nr:hypothetical protein KUCAC02_027447 [Chaenocephalus aceratus]